MPEQLTAVQAISVEPLAGLWTLGIHPETSKCNEPGPITGLRGSRSRCSLGCRLRHVIAEKRHPGRRGRFPTTYRKHRRERELTVESPGGIAPPGAHRTGLETLASSGSYRPAGGLASKRQRKNNPGSRTTTRPNQWYALTQWPRRRLYFRIAHFIRANVKLRLSTWMHRDR